MDPLQAPDIPETHVAFAKAVAALADGCGIERFQLTFRPHWHGLREMERGQHINGDLRIDYHSTDGRGRPCRNLAITLTATLVQHIEKTPESFG